jgi:hypothetical protein
MEGVVLALTVSSSGLQSFGTLAAKKTVNSLWSHR